MQTLTGQEPSSRSLAFPNLGRWSAYHGKLPGTREDYAAIAGCLWENAAVRICLDWIADAFLEPNLVAQKGKGKGKNKPLDSHPCLDLLAKPNPYYDGATLNAVNTLSYYSGGEYFNLKVRNNYKQAVELYYLHYQHVTPISLNGEFISYYEYHPGWGSRVQYFAAEDILHVRHKADPLDARRGLSPLRAVLREIATDNAASTYTAALLENLGALTVIISPEDENTTVTAEDAEDIKRRLRNVTRDRTGDPLVFPGRVKVTEVGLSPEDMNLDEIRHFPEDRICAALRLNTIALGLTSGSGSKTYANYEQAVRAQYHGCLMPLQSTFANAWNAQLMPEFDDTGNVSLSWDYSGVEALQEDTTALVNRSIEEYQSGLIDRAEYRALRGYDVRPEDKDVYYGGKSVIAPDRPEQDS